MGNAESTGDRSRDLYNAAKRGDVDGVARLHGQGAGLEWRDAKVRLGSTRSSGQRLCVPDAVG